MRGVHGFDIDSYFIVYFLPTPSVVAVQMLEDKSVMNTADCRTCKLEYCELGMCPDVCICIAYVILSSYIARWRIVDKFIVSFCSMAVMH